MFGFSFAELIVVLLVILFFIKPKDLPEIAHFIGRVIYRAKKFYADLKNSLKEMQKEMKLDELKYELDRGVAEEKARIEEDTTTIVDMYGNEHQVPSPKKENLESELVKIAANQKGDPSKSEN